MWYMILVRTTCQLSFEGLGTSFNDRDNMDSPGGFVVERE